MEKIFSLILILPVLSFLIICSFGHKLGVYGSMLLSVINMLMALLCALWVLVTSSFTHLFYIEAWRWLSITGFDSFFSLRYDALTGIMFLVVTGVSCCVHLYSCVYMYTDANVSRFMSYLSLFTFFMLLLVSSSNLLVLFLGWEGVGLCSYLLIGF
jgi:NADH-quinone oxidoreductase subunit L